MEPSQISAIKNSFERLTASNVDYTTAFYARVFEIAPAAAGLFKDDLTEQKKALHATLALVVNGLERFGQLESAIFDLGKRHIQYGVAPEHFPVVAEALLDTLTSCAPDFTEEERLAWQTGVSAISDIMLRAWDENEQAV